MIVTLLITVIVEGVVVIGYSTWRNKPVRPLLFTSILGNLVTQSLLWIVLLISFRHYVGTLIVAEILAWLIESLLLYFVSANRLNFREAVFLSLGMNLASLALGWFMPV